MAGYVNASWELPPLSWLNISSCDSIAPWMAYYMVLVSDESNKSAAPVNVVVKFLGSLVPDNWTQPTEGDLLLWYTDFTDYFRTDNAQTFDKIIDFALSDCGPKMCPNLDFSGDSDLSGIGMMISYYMVAIFVTLYYFALVPGFFEAYGHPFKPSTLASRYRKFASGFEESVAGFLDAMLLFAISMLIAAITRYAAVIRHPHKTHSLFGLQDCVFLSAFAIFPAFVLQSLSYNLRRQGVRLTLWSLVLIFVITVEVLYRLKYRNWIYDESAMAEPSLLSQIAWFALCQSESLRQSLQTMLSVGHGVMIVNSAAWVYSIAENYAGQWWLPSLQKRTRLWKRWNTCRLWLRLGNGLLCLATMWAFLGLFTVYRHDVTKKAGEADEDDDWTFGQVLSLTTWIPIGIELVSVYIYGAQEGAQEKLSQRYKVVEKTETEVFQDNVAYEKTPGVEVAPLADAHA